MLVLGIESATHQVGAAVGGHEGVLSAAHTSRGKRHAELLTPTIDFVRRSARIELDEISCIAVDLGPGLFTGLRVGIAAAKAMAQALRVPMIGVPSLDLLAFPVRHTSRLIVTAIDARRGEVFYATYRDGVPLTAPVCVTPAALAEQLAGLVPCLAVGDGAARYEAVLAAAGAEVVPALPSADAALHLALAARAAGAPGLDAAEVEACYLRAPDARANFVVLSQAGR